MIEIQNIANEIRDRLVDHEAIRRLGIEVLWAAGTADALTIRARHRDRVLTVERAGGWHQNPARDQAVELAHELVAAALDNLRASPAPARWRRGGEDPSLRTQPQASGPAVRP